MLPVSQISSVEIIIMKRVLEDPSRGVIMRYGRLEGE